MDESEGLTWEQVREGLAQDLAPVEVDAAGLPVPTVQVAPRQPRIWPWVLGIGALLWFASRR